MNNSIVIGQCRAGNYIEKGMAVVFLFVCSSRAETNKVDFNVLMHTSVGTEIISEDE